jgi:glycosyltransferase involved in cell wall biosynthesis
MVLKAGIPPPDIRVEKEAKTLIAAGHDVHLLLEGRPGEDIEEVVDGIRYQRGVTMSPLREKYHRYTFSFTFRDSLWRRAIEDFARKRNVDVLHVHDLPLVQETVTVARSLGVPVVADLHENYPAGLQVWYESTIKKRTIYKLDRWVRYERRMLDAVDALIVVIEESKERLVSLGVDPGTIFVVPNTASRERDRIPMDDEIIERYRDFFMLTYIGGFAGHRGLDVVVRALPLVRDRIPGLKAVLVGDRNEAYRAYLGRLARDLGCEHTVEMTGWQPFEKIWSYIEASDVCLVPHARNPHTDTTIPHKIFQYMMSEKPVIVSDCPPLARIARDSGGGLVFTYDDPSELAKCILELYESPQLREQLSRSGREAFEDRYNWDSTSGELVELYRTLGKGGER